MKTSLRFQRACSLHTPVTSDDKKYVPYSTLLYPICTLALQGYPISKESAKKRDSLTYSEYTWLQLGPHAFSQSLREPRRRSTP